MNSNKLSGWEQIRQQLLGQQDAKMADIYRSCPQPWQQWPDAVPEPHSLYIDGWWLEIGGNGTDGEVPQ